jgi:glutathione S-transferase
VLVYHMPGSCSRVTLIALEECGLDYEDRSVALLGGAQQRPEYRAINWKGKVPALVVEGVVVTESPVILTYLARRQPDAGLLPATVDEAAALEGLSDLMWCSGTLHPLVHRVFRPTGYTSMAPEGVKQTAMTQLEVTAQVIFTRLHGGGWWYGHRWSIVDAYVAWCLAVAAQVDFPIHAHPVLQDHRRRTEARPSFRSMQVRERAAIERDQLQVPSWYS